MAGYKAGEVPVALFEREVTLMASDLQADFVPMRGN